MRGIGGLRVQRERSRVPLRAGRGPVLRHSGDASLSLVCGVAPPSSTPRGLGGASGSTPAGSFDRACITTGTPSGDSTRLRRRAPSAQFDREDSASGCVGESAAAPAAKLSERVVDRGDTARCVPTQLYSAGLDGL
ncbi:hypothetical protein DIPPA_26235 [Diplonema papillatum]|nr:hypothetical protein DIPPA_26235 [Diplonema papillatum]